jgi:thiamine phosphate synthase YjbQ (UPF0047 family)
MSEQKTLSFHTRGGGTHDFTVEVERVVRASKLCAGTVQPVPAAHQRLADPVREEIRE